MYHNKRQTNLVLHNVAGIDYTYTLLVHNNVAGIVYTRKNGLIIRYVLKNQYDKRYQVYYSCAWLGIKIQ